MTAGREWILSNMFDERGGLSASTLSGTTEAGDNVGLVISDNISGDLDNVTQRLRSFGAQVPDQIRTVGQLEQAVEQLKQNPPRKRNGAPKTFQRYNPETNTNETINPADASIADVMTTIKMNPREQKSLARSLFVLEQGDAVDVNQAQKLQFRRGEAVPERNFPFTADGVENAVPNAMMNNQPVNTRQPIGQVERYERGRMFNTTLGNFGSSRLTVGVDDKGQPIKANIQRLIADLDPSTRINNTINDELARMNGQMMAVSGGVGMTPDQVDAVRRRLANDLGLNTVGSFVNDAQANLIGLPADRTGNGGLRYTQGRTDQGYLRWFRQRNDRDNARRAERGLAPRPFDMTDVTNAIRRERQMRPLVAQDQQRAAEFIADRRGYGAGMYPNLSYSTTLENAEDIQRLGIDPSLSQSAQARLDRISNGSGPYTGPVGSRSIGTARDGLPASVTASPAYIDPGPTVGMGPGADFMRDRNAPTIVRGLRGGLTNPVIVDQNSTAPGVFRPMSRDLARQNFSSPAEAADAMQASMFTGPFTQRGETYQDIERARLLGPNGPASNFTGSTAPPTAIPADTDPNDLLGGQRNMTNRAIVTRSPNEFQAADPTVIRSTSTPGAPQATGQVGDVNMSALQALPGQPINSAPAPVAQTMPIQGGEAVREMGNLTSNPDIPDSPLNAPTTPQSQATMPSGINSAGRSQPKTEREARIGRFSEMMQRVGRNRRALGIGAAVAGAGAGVYGINEAIQDRRAEEREMREAAIIAGIR